MNTAADHHAGFASALLAPHRAPPTGLRARDQDERERRFAVHRNNVVVNLVDALADTFPVTRALVGEDFFRMLARARVLADPPRSPVLIDYAEGFPAFVASFAPAASVSYLADVAWIEASCVAAYHAADAAPMPPEAYARWLADPDALARCRVTLHPAARWLRSAHPVHALWAAHQDAADLARVDLGHIDLSRAEDVLVERPALEVEVVLLPPGAAEFLDALRSGLALGPALAQVLARHPSLAPAGLFALLLQRGLAIRLDDTLEIA